MSPRAAWRLAAMGFEAFEYTAGKADWLARGKPREGELAEVPLVADVVRDDAVTCGLDADPREVARRVEESDIGFALVVNEQRVVLGRLRGSTVDEQPGAPIEQLLEPGPVTARAGEPVHELVERLDRLDLRWMPITTPSGVLLGVFDRERADAG